MASLTSLADLAAQLETSTLSSPSTDPSETASAKEMRESEPGDAAAHDTATLDPNDHDAPPHDRLHDRMVPAADEGTQDTHLREPSYAGPAETASTIPLLDPSTRRTEETDAGHLSSIPEKRKSGSGPSSADASHKEKRDSSALRASGKPKKKKGFWAALLAALSCVSPSDVDGHDTVQPAKVPVHEAPEPLSEKSREPLVEPTVPSATVPEPAPEPALSTSDSEPHPAAAPFEALTVPAVLLSPPSTSGDEAVIVPPRPHAHTLPTAETEGVTSGAVQPPGSTGADDGGDGDDDGSEGSDEVIGESTEDEDERLMLNGGAGIPIIDGQPRPLLPPLSAAHAGRKCLVLDMDETLLHSSFKVMPQADFIIPVSIEFQWHNVYMIKRPGVDAFLKRMGELYEVVVFTASLGLYANPVLDKLDIHGAVTHRLFRESCFHHKGIYVKDLSQLGRPIKDTIILDNSPASYIFHPNNAVPVSSWFNDPHDTELTDLCPFLTDLLEVDDVRGVLDGGLS